MFANTNHENFFCFKIRFTFVLKDDLVGSVVEWLERRDCDRHILGSKSARATLLCLWERHFTSIFLLVLASSSKFQSYL